MAKDLTQALHEATLNAQGQTSRKDEKLPAAKPVSAIPERNGIGRPGGNAAGSIASPLVEGDYAAREWHAERTMISSDGILTLKYRPLGQVTFFDKNGAEVVIEFAPTP